MIPSVPVTADPNPKYTTKISFDEWGAWHPEATVANCQRQRQTVRDAIFAALSLHIFYRNSDVVEFAMETQLTNLLQSLFETDGERIYRTPTYHVMKILRPHLGQYLVPALPNDEDTDLDTVATMSEDGKSMTVSIVNRHLYDEKEIGLCMDEEWQTVDARIVTAADVRTFNTYDEPENIVDAAFEVEDTDRISVPPHSVLRICFSKN